MGILANKCYVWLGHACILPTNHISWMYSQRIYCWNDALHFYATPRSEIVWKCINWALSRVRGIKEKQTTWVTIWRIMHLLYAQTTDYFRLMRNKNNFFASASSSSFSCFLLCQSSVVRLAFRFSDNAIACSNFCSQCVAYAIFISNKPCLWQKAIILAAK